VCHLPHVATRIAASEAIINPFTDLLLHDMGDALADTRPDFDAKPNDWRTPPLWGLGMLQTVSGHTNLLHDGRARGFTEAILWHGGEATKSRQAFIRLPSRDREAIIRFLQSL
jgi:CxxC motif-containing protein (DUF1111 family)